MGTVEYIYVPDTSRLSGVSSGGDNCETVDAFRGGDGEVYYVLSSDHVESGPGLKFRRDVLTALQIWAKSDPVPAEDHRAITGTPLHFWLEDDLICIGLDNGSDPVRDTMGPFMELLIYFRSGKIPELRDDESKVFATT